MSAKAEAKAAAALRELGATLKASATAPKLKTLQLFKDLGLDEEEDELELNIMEEIASLVKNADGPAGDQVKYEHAVGSMVKRWKLFVALYDLGEQEPTHEMVKLFVGFMYTYRQRTSKTGRQGLGDSMAEMAQYILAQAVFEKMGYAEWVGLSTEDKKVKSAPYRELIKDTWARLKRSKPEMQSAS